LIAEANKSKAQIHHFHEGERIGGAGLIAGYGAKSERRKANAKTNPNAVIRKQEGRQHDEKKKIFALESLFLRPSVYAVSGSSG